MNDDPLSPSGDTEPPDLALSVRQPWAWAIIHAGKDIENRSRIAIRKGRMEPCRIVIHASKGMTCAEYEWARNFMAGGGVQCPRPEELVRGALIGSVWVTEIVTRSTSRWFVGPCGLRLLGPLPWEPIPAPGALGFFEWTAGGEIERPKPWMLKWSPSTPPPKPRLLKPLPLFGDSK